MSEKSLNVELRRLNRIKDAFLANTSHELRTPLNGIIGIAESVYEEAKGKLDQTLLNKLSFIALSGKRLSSLINDILDYSKLGKNKLTIYPKSVDLAEVTHNAVMLLQPLAREKNLIIINRVKPTLSMVFADENRLQQVLLNLIGNAIKYTDHGSIRIFASENDGFMEVHISDNGVGMDPKDIKYIFNAFHQIEDQVQQGKGGTGLGLAVTKELIELQGGQIWVESKKNVGSTFSFKIPLHTSKQSASAPPPN